jgi:hypothetical protein
MNMSTGKASNASTFLTKFIFPNVASLAGTRTGFNASKGFDDLPKAGSKGFASQASPSPQNVNPFTQTNASLGTNSNTANLKGKLTALDVYIHIMKCLIGNDKNIE